MPGSEPHAAAARQSWMAILARATAAEIEALLSAAPSLPAWVRVRGPEVGSVMARGRVGGTAAPFNLGEIAVARCTVRLEDGAIGHAYVRGRDLRLAELAAALDAALQDPARAPTLRSAVINPLAAAQNVRRERIARKAAATQVQFFTLATMRS